MNKWVIAGLITVTLMLCSSGDTLPIPELEGAPETVALITDSWEDLLDQCPGLSHYQNDLKFVGINDMLHPMMKEMARVEVRYKVANDPEDIPNKFRINGHTCGFGIGPDGETLRIQKNGCAAVCLIEEYDSDGDDFVTDL